MEVRQNSFIKRLKSMLAVDLRRMFTTKFIYITTAICTVVPVLILVMTNMNSQEGEGMFYSAWQLIGSLPGAAGGMDMAMMMNINMLYFLAGIVVAVFVSGDFKSGFSKNLFTVRAKKIDYILSKLIVCTLGCAFILLGYFVGDIIGSAVAGLSFEMPGFTAFNILCCMVSKIALLLVFVSIYLCMGIIGKQKTWLSSIGSLIVCMFLFMMVSMIAPLTSTIMNILLCLIGGILFSLLFTCIANTILKKTSLV